ncbi:MAG: 50S ribosomal protein L21 [Oscillospiraceae bacterium]|nr:50S ribosomal protein L21 [Oscillospiraceae bacterium]MBQ2602733.1 50S ribosomal protein L21 [Oscillospiraceae bacterium]
MTAIIEACGKQYRVQPGDTLFVEKLGEEDGAKVTFDKVLAVVADDGSAVIGKPVVEGATVTATVVKTGKSKKIIVYKMHPKKNYRRKQGHRQPYTKLTIDSVNA